MVLRESVRIEPRKLHYDFIQTIVIALNKKYCNKVCRRNAGGGQTEACRSSSTWGCASAFLTFSRPKILMCILERRQ